MVRRLRVLAPVLFAPSLVLAIMIALNERNEPRSWLRYVVVSMLLVWTVIRIARTVPINSAILEWNPEAPLGDWRSLVQRTGRFLQGRKGYSVLPFGLPGHRNCLQGGRLLPGLLHKLRVWIGMCPEGEEMLVGIDGGRPIAFGGESPAELTSRQANPRSPRKTSDTFCASGT